MISVIVPAYNAEPYLFQCLDSILAQIYTDLEIILIDDGSTDHCGEVCDEYAVHDSRICVFHTENRGLSAARNLGLDQAKGDYIGFVDSDDWIESDMYERLIHTAEQTGADIVSCRFYQEYIGKTEESSGPSESLVLEGSEILHTYLFDHRICQDSWNNLFRADLFHVLRYPEGRSFEDYAIKPHLLQNARMMVYIPFCLLHYRNRQNSLSNVHSLKSNVDYWLTFRDRYILLSPMSEDYYRLSLAQTIGAIGRTWRWFAGYSKEEKRQAELWLDDMQRFNSAHFQEIIKNPAFSRDTKFTCFCAKSRSALLFEALYRTTRIYRRLRTVRNYYP